MQNDPPDVSLWIRLVMTTKHTRRDVLRGSECGSVTSHFESIQVRLLAPSLVEWCTRIRVLEYHPTSSLPRNWGSTISRTRLTYALEISLTLAFWRYKWNSRKWTYTRLPLFTYTLTSHLTCSTIHNMPLPWDIGCYCYLVLVFLVGSQKSTLLMSLAHLLVASLTPLTQALHLL